MASNTTVSGNETEPALVRRYNVERSCLRCHERKVRCNKAMPCSACIRANVQCRYPGPERTKRRSQKGAQVQLGSRLERLERALGAMTAIPERAHPKTDARLLNVEGSNGNSLSPPPPSEVPRPDSARRNRNSPPEHHQTRGLLVQDGASTRYINEAMLSQMLEKVINQPHR
jgi:Fungal Zn(2)-Cys(6) binuclear cluster domain